MRIDYENGAGTLYDYDPLTFRLVQLYDPPRLLHRLVRTLADVAAPAAPPGCRSAEPALHLRPGRQHHPHPGRRAADDLLPQQARRAERRLHLRRRLPADRGHRPRASGAGRRRPIPHSSDDAGRVGLPHPARTAARMGTYLERYVYDAVGNFLQMQHRGSDPAHPGWTRDLRLRRNEPDREPAS